MHPPLFEASTASSVCTVSTAFVGQSPQLFPFPFRPQHGPPLRREWNGNEHTPPTRFLSAACAAFTLACPCIRPIQTPPGLRATCAQIPQLLTTQRTHLSAHPCAHLRDDGFARPGSGHTRKETPRDEFDFAGLLVSARVSRVPCMCMYPNPLFAAAQQRFRLALCCGRACARLGATLCTRARIETAGAPWEPVGFPGTCRGHPHTTLNRCPFFNIAEFPLSGTGTGPSGSCLDPAPPLPALARPHWGLGFSSNPEP